MTVHPLEGGQVAATSGPGGPCQPHTVQQLTEERKKKGGRGWAVWRGDKRDQEKERKDLDMTERERNCKVLCPSWAGLHLLEFQQEATSPLDSNRRGEAIGFGPV